MSEAVIQKISRRGRAALIAIVVVAAFAVYANSLKNGFVYDDQAQILENPWVRDFSWLRTVFSSPVGYANYYRPLMYVTYMGIYHFFGLNAWAFHLVNVLVHCLNSVLVFLVAGKILPAKEEGGGPVYLHPPFVAALLFALHPIHTEVVAWVACIPDLFLVLFGLASLYLYQLSCERGEPPWGARRVASLLLFLCATLSKETALILPAVLIAWDYALGRLSKAGRAGRYLPYFGVALLYFIIRVAAIGKGMPVKNSLFTPFECLINVFPLLDLYLKKLLVPVDLNAAYELHLAHGVNLEVVVGLLAAAVLAGALFKLPRRAPALFFGLFLVLLPLLPVLYIPAIPRPFAERYLYLPSVGLVLIVAALLARAAARPKAAAAGIGGALALVSVLFATGTVRRNPVWHDNCALWTDTVEKSPDDAPIRDNLGNALVSQGRLDEAITQYAKSLSLPDNPAPDRTHVGLAYALDKEGRLDEAADQYRQALQVNPGLESAHVNLAIILNREGKLDQSIAEYREALRIKPDDAPVHVYLGMELSQEGQLPQALDEFAQAERIAPGYEPAHNAMGIALWSAGRRAEAVREFETAVQMAPGDESARRNLQMALAGGR